MDMRRDSTDAPVNTEDVLNENEDYLVRIVTLLVRRNAALGTIVLLDDDIWSDQGILTIDRPGNGTVVLSVRPADADVEA